MSPVTVLDYTRLSSTLNQMRKNETDNDAASKPRRGRPRDPERYQRILEAARSHFYAHGLERASVEAIAAEAGVSKMTAYSHFCGRQCGWSWRPTREPSEPTGEAPMEQCRHQ